MKSMSGRRPLQLTAALLLCHTLGAATPDPDRVPIEAKLVHALQAGRVRVGDPVFAKVQVKWQGSGCSLREGAILRGRVLAETTRSKAAKTSQVSLLFEGAECEGGDMQALPMTLAALIVPDPAGDRNAYEPMALSAAIGGIQNGAMERKPPGHSRITPSQIRATRIAEPQHRHKPQAVKPGEVVGIDGVKLAVASGPQGSSVISSTRRNLNLEAATQIVLLINPKTTPQTADRTASVAMPKTPEPEPFIDETEVCSPPACSIALGASDSENRLRSALTVLTKDFGYPAPPTLEMVRFDHQAAIAYLGPDQLLLTFNPHALVPRPGLESGARTMRMVRGVLMDLTTMKARKVSEWRVPDSNQYLWPIGTRGVLIHAGRELKVYGAGLKLEQSIVLEGPLAFVCSSPSGAYIAIGVTHERHSDEVHRQLREAETQEPEEDVNVRVLDGGFKTVVNVNRSSRAPPPVLLDGGEVQTINAGGTRWRLVETSWNGEQRILARTTSACRPQTTSLPPGILFMVGCDIAEYGRWYRVLGSDGKALLKGRSPSDELEQIASASPASPIFAVAVTKVGKPRMTDEVFHASDLKSTYVSVHSAENGRKLLGVSVPAPLPTLQTFALSGDGGQLAVLQSGEIAVYNLPGRARASH